MSYRHWIALVVSLTSAATFFVGCSDDEDACVADSYRCTGQMLERCVDQDGSLAFVLLETCTEDEMCHADHGHCHPMGEGGGHAGGSHAGGSHEGGSHEGGHHEGGHHEGGTGGH